MLVRELLVEGSALLTTAGIDNPALDSQILLAALLKRDRTWLWSHDDETVDETILVTYRELITRRVMGQPVAYLVGTKGFWKSDFGVAPGVLVPRPETELLVEVCLSSFDDTPRVCCDLGTGSGAIIISVALERPNWTCIGTDASHVALSQANTNRLKLCNSVSLVQADWTSLLKDQSVDILLSNPPYICEQDPHLPALQYEPIEALTSGTSGLDAITHIVRDAPRIVRVGGALILEHGLNQATQVQRLLDDAGFKRISSYNDLAGIPRITIGWQEAPNG